MHRDWVLAWSCTVVFSDNAATLAAIKELIEQEETLAAHLAELKTGLADHRKHRQVGAWPAPMQNTGTPSRTVQQRPVRMFGCHVELCWQYHFPFEECCWLKQQLLLRSKLEQRLFGVELSCQSRLPAKW